MSNTVSDTLKELHRHFEVVCREKGLRVTFQRLKIYQAVTSTKKHPTAEMIYEELRDEMPGLSLNTVYRTLETFEQHGIIDQLPSPSDSARFDGATERHHHFVCDRCGAIGDVEWPELENIKPPSELDRLGKVERMHVYFQGRCERCLAEDPADSESR